MTSKQKIIFYGLFFLAIIYYATGFFTVEKSSREYWNYTYLFLSFIAVIILIMNKVLRKDYYFFEPFTIASALYVMIFIAQPMSDIRSGEFFSHGTDVMDGCIKATLIFLFSYISFYIGYSVPDGKHVLKQVESTGTERVKLNKYKEMYDANLRTVCLAFWTIGFVFAVMYYIFSGRDPLTSLTLGLFGSSEDTGISLRNIDSSVKFLMKLAFIMIIPWIYIMHFDKNKLLKIIISALMFMHFIAMGSRYVLVVCAVSVFALPYLSEKKRVSFNKIAVIFSFMLVVAGIIGYTRTGIGRELDFSAFGSKDIFAVFDSDFTIYRAFYGMVENIPHSFPYQLGKGLIVYSLVSVVPSSIFPYKRNFDNVYQIVEASVSSKAAIKGIAYPNLGQYYAEFGIIGCFILMFIFGLILRKLKRLYEGRKYNLHSLILYSVIFPFLMQIIVRGDFAQQIHGLLGLTIPYFFIKLFTTDQKRKIMEVINLAYK